MDSEEFEPSGSFRSRFFKSWEEFQGISRFWKDFRRKMKNFQGFGRIQRIWWDLGGFKGFGGILEDLEGKDWEN